MNIIWLFLLIVFPMQVWATIETAPTGLISRYSGNIAAWRRHTPKLSDSTTELYTYDVLQRLRNATTLTSGMGSSYTYDKGGNILNLQRKNAAGTTTDNIKYAYNRGTDKYLTNNKLRAVNDSATAEGLPNGRHNYRYDANGRLAFDSLQGLSLSWTVDNKPLSVGNAGSGTRYLYDASGNRVARKTSRIGAADTTYFQIRTSNGTEIALIRKVKKGDTTYVTLQEATIGGESRLGIYSNPTLLAKGTNSLPEFINYNTTDTIKSSGRIAGLRRYQISDHLGNVRAVVSDQKHSTYVGGYLNLSANVLSANEYYPFGMVEKSYAGSNNKYRWGYNGKETDANLGNANDYNYGFRAYDASIARFFSVDPLREKYPELTTYQFASNTPIQAIDLDGLEAASYRIKNSKIETTLPSDHLIQRLAPDHQPIHQSSYKENRIKVDATVSVGFQVGLNTPKYGAEINGGSKDLGAIHASVDLTDWTNRPSLTFDGPSNSTKSGVALKFNGVGIEVEKEKVTTGYTKRIGLFNIVGLKTTENSTLSVSYGIAAAEATKTTTNYSTSMGKRTESSKSRGIVGKQSTLVPEAKVSGAKVSAGIGVSVKAQTVE